MFHSQNNEAEVISNYFGDRIGTVLDLGANDGITFSNSYDLIQKGWAAYLVEPCNEPYNAAWKRHLYADNVSVYHLAIGTKDEQGIIYEPGDTLIASSNKDLLSKWEHAKNYKETQVEFCTWPTFYSRIRQPKVQFVTIDCEGMDLDILKQMNLDEMGVECICLEHGNDRVKYQAMKDHCAQYGLTKELLYNYENVILAK